MYFEFRIIAHFRHTHLDIIISLRDAANCVKEKKFAKFIEINDIE